jgi:hypothetical protein
MPAGNPRSMGGRRLIHACRDLPGFFSRVRGRLQTACRLVRAEDR